MTPKRPNQASRAVMEPPALARFLPIEKYTPGIGDFLIWSGWFRTWYGVVAGVSANGQALTVIWEGLPSLLFTLTDAEQKKASREMLLEKIVSAKPGSMSVMKHDAQRNTTVWFV